MIAPSGPSSALSAQSRSIDREPDPDSYAAIRGYPNHDLLRLRPNPDCDRDHHDHDFHLHLDRDHHDPDHEPDPGCSYDITHIMTYSGCAMTTIATTPCTPTMTTTSPPTNRTPVDTTSPKS